ncbi:MAG: Smr/MutS family protein [Gemmatimonadaceae bacterium]|nr:Smr/MutS family protein [Gemmatimonadaceae bacterium]
MNPHALSVLEFARVLDVVADRAATPLGAAAVRALAPTTDAEWLAAEHSRIAAMRALLASEGSWAPEPLVDVRMPLARLRLEGASLDGLALVGMAMLLRGARRTREALRDARRPAMALAWLAPFVDALVSAPRDEEAIDRAIDGDGTVRDDASPTLRRLRRELLGAQGELVRVLERVMGTLESHHQVSDMSVTVRNGRYVIPIRASGRNVVGGIVHDASGTGATLFVEPPAAVEFGNRIRELEAAEAEEVERILLELTDRIRPLQPQLVEAFAALVALDALYARARYANEFRCEPAELGHPQDGLQVVDGRHPLLLARGATVVPFDLVLLPEERTLLISGPNTGGKTVLLKALGLFCAMMQSGIPAPVGHDSRIPVVDDIFADVGDEQSIEASLSTFSAHVRHQREILRSATHASLVLVDELGSGTDPLEGAALGGAILEALTARGTLTIATTHLGALKELATEVRGVVNASLQFDAVQLAPTYRLLKGIPGRSYGLSIARRLELPESVLQRAEERVPQVERDVHRLLADLEARDTLLAEQERALAQRLDDVTLRDDLLRNRERTVKERERELERDARREAKKYLLEARAEVERTIASLKAAGASQVEEAAKAARRHVEQQAQTQGARLDRIEEEDRRRAHDEARRKAAAGAALAVGDLVEATAFGGRVGTLVELREGMGVVAIGALKMSFPVATLKGTGRRPEKPQVSVSVSVALDEAPPPAGAGEVDLRGMRVSEIDDALGRAIDDAVRADLRSVRIIHGKGTGALRERVTQLLRGDRRVGTSRLGLWNEGGAGVTIAELR